MTTLFKQSIYTLQDINELYKTYYNINKYYHFTYKTEKTALNFGNYELSLIDKECHQFILDDVTSVSQENSLILTSSNKKHTIAYDHIPKNYQFDIITSTIDGTILIIYHKKV